MILLFKFALKPLGGLKDIGRSGKLDDRIHDIFRTSPMFTSCSTGWIDLGLVTNNNNSITFEPDAAYGGWTNPMSYYFSGTRWKVRNFSLQLTFL